METFTVKSKKKEMKILKTLQFFQIRQQGVTEFVYLISIREQFYVM